MTNQELLLDFQIKYNRLAGNSNLGLSYEEIDWYLNEAMLHKIRKLLDRKFNKEQEDQNDTKMNLFDLEALFVQTVLPVNKTNEEFGQSVIPADFFHLESVDALVNTSCDTKTIVTTNKSYKYVVVPLPTVNVGSWSFNVTISSISTPVFNLSNIQNNAGYPTVTSEENYLFVHRILQYVNSQNLVKVFWENYADVYEKNSFIFVYSGTGSLTGSTNVINTQTTNISPLTIVNPQINFTDSTKPVSCRIEPAEIVGVVKKNPFMRSSKKSPVVSPVKGFLRIYFNDFNISGLNILYIRKPKVIDYRVAQSIDLGTTLAQKYKIGQDIVDLAVANASARTTTENYQVLQSKTI